MCALQLRVFEGRTVGSKVYHGGDGFFYHLNNSRRNRRFVYMRCARADRQIPCYGTAKATAGWIFHLAPHNHDANPLYPWVQNLRKAVTRRVRSGDSTSYEEMMQQESRRLRYNMDIRSQLPVAQIRARMDQIRSELRPPVPQSLDVLGAYLLLPEYRYLTECLHTDDSLFAGTCGNLADGTLSLVFICSDMKNFMATRSIVFADGTERKLFNKPKASQIFTLVGSWRYTAIPMLRAIMVRKTQVAYETLLEFVQELVPAFDPDKVMCDFEEGQMNAWQVRFPNAIVEGCLWHYAMAVFSYAKDLGLSPFIKEFDELGSIVRAACALPMLTRDEIKNGLDDLGWEAVASGWMDELKLFFRYLEREWMSKVNILSVHGSAHRTNNCSETSNKCFNTELKGCHPSYHNVLKAFVNINDRALVDLRVLARHKNARRQRKQSALSNDATIKILGRDLANGDISRLEFLHLASRRMQNVFNTVFK